MIKTLIALFLTLHCITTYSSSLDSNKTSKYYVLDNKKWLAEIPLWIPGFRGQLAYGDVNLTPTDNKDDRERLTSELGIEFYFAGRIAAQFNKVWFALDAFSGTVSSTFFYSSKLGNIEKEYAKVSIGGTIPRFLSGFSIWTHPFSETSQVTIVPYIGIRYVNLKVNSELPNGAILFDLTPNWVEPVIGIYIPIDVKRFRLEGQADYGSISSKYSWCLQSHLRYRISKLLEVKAGWTYIRLNHHANINDNRLNLDISLNGPSAGIGFRF